MNRRLFFKASLTLVPIAAISKNAVASEVIKADKSQRILNLLKVYCDMLRKSMEHHWMRYVEFSPGMWGWKGGTYEEIINTPVILPDESEKDSV